MHTPCITNIYSSSSHMILQTYAHTFIHTKISLLCVTPIFGDTISVFTSTLLVIKLFLKWSMQINRLTRLILDCYLLTFDKYVDIINCHFWERGASCRFAYKIDIVSLRYHLLQKSGKGLNILNQLEHLKWAKGKIQAYLKQREIFYANSCSEKIAIVYF